MVATLQNLTVPLCIAVVVLFGVAALWKSSIERKKQTTEFFLTARNSQSWYRIGWSFYAATTGSGVLYAAPQFVADAGFGAGWIGLLSYSVFIGVPILMIAYMGEFVKSKVPHILSIGHFARWRYGRAVEVFVALQVLLNLGIAMTAEYTAIGDLFVYVLDMPRILPIVLTGSVTIIYTIAGGLLVSIITDQWQAIFSMFLLVITVVYVAATFRPGPLPELPPYLAANNYGYASLLTLSASLISSTLFSDAIWQRVWASENESSLKKGGWLGACLTTLVVFWFGLCGFLSTWAGYSTTASTAFFDILIQNGSAPLWIVTVVCLFAVTMNEAAIDSFQNAICDTILSVVISFGFNVPLWVVRVTVILINVPLIVVALQGYSLVSLYLLTNLLTTCAMIPLILGLFRSFDQWVTGRSFLFSFLFAFFAIGTYGYYMNGNDFAYGLYVNFFLVPDWPQFLIALVGSVVGLCLYIGAELVIYKLIGLPYPSDVIEAKSAE